MKAIAVNIEHCQVKMNHGRICGRAVHQSQSGADSQHVCLMHSSDHEKSDVEFQAELDRILESAGERQADFTGFVFPGRSYRGAYKATCYFNSATFMQTVTFEGSFFREAHFAETTFMQDACFDSCFFGVGSWDEFKIYAGSRDLLDERQKQRIFYEVDTFSRAKFNGATSFDQAFFVRTVDFSGASFNGDVNFEAAQFCGKANFFSARFREAATFSCYSHSPLKWGDGAGSWSKADFAHARFERPEKVTIHMLEMKECFLLGGDVSKVNFSNVFWKLREDGKRMVAEEEFTRCSRQTLNRNRGAYLRYVLKGGRAPFYAFESDRNRKDLLKKDEMKEPLALFAGAKMYSAFDDRPHYRIIAELYQQLKKNYENRGDYSTAGDFHYGEMEMRRWDRGREKKSILLWWIRRNLGLLALYKLASKYGESYVRPGWLLLLVLFTFVLLYPVAGLRHDTARDLTPSSGESNNASQGTVLKLTYWHPLYGDHDDRPLWQARVDLLGCSAITTAGIALFLRDLPYEPLAPWGSLLKVAEMLLTSILAALFLLAMRRHFKR